MKKFIIPDIVFYFFLIVLGLGGFFFAIAWPQTIGFRLFTLCASLAGLGVTIYIWYSKRFKKHLACPTGSNCNEVVNSKYAHFLGVSLEYFGMLYYALIFLSYLIFIIYPSVTQTIFYPAILLATAGAFAFSIYLVVIQAFVLRKWCIWCLLSAGLSTAIFLASLSSMAFASTFLTNSLNVLFLLEDLGFVLGLGGATASIFIFFKFLNDSHIDDNEARAFKGLSEMTWLGLGLIFIAKYALYSAVAGSVTPSALFIVQLLSLSIVFISGAILNVQFAPFISVMPFEDKDPESISPLEKMRKGALITGAIGIASWYFAFITRFMSGHTLGSLVLLYLVILVLGLLVGMTMIDKRIKDAKDNPPRH